MAKSKLVHGIGRNDADYPVTIYDVIDGKLKQLRTCHFYHAWKHMIARCYSQKFQAKYPTYRGCSVTPGWHSFAAFRAWMLTQPWEGSELDKDILEPGNKVYSPDACIFVPSHLNMFMTDRAAARGEWPIGVSWQKSADKFKAYCRNPFTCKQEHLGMFSDPDAAHEAWRKRKHELACLYAEQQTDPRIAQALRTRYL
ncbi:hypothetical protein [uncultured Pseudomonas sp.]|uniref:hypothetical protein n=1 Tax=uncultured Pseudomonas sp. TaxID=114707 RepID=UPI0030D86DB2|tara:strand:- start:13430 stop:14023 length:594 start_codon:yes stop_codon:yes gene_type:complete